MNINKVFFGHSWNFMDIRVKWLKMLQIMADLINFVKQLLRFDYGKEDIFCRVNPWRARRRRPVSSHHQLHPAHRCCAHRACGQEQPEPCGTGSGP